jgi:hypothetical protein
MFSLPLTGPPIIKNSFAQDNGTTADEEGGEGIAVPPLDERTTTTEGGEGIAVPPLDERTTEEGNLTNQGEICNDGTDNDSDGLLDADDTQDCGSTGAIAPIIGEESIDHQEICDNSIDDDGDGLLDADDTEDCPEQTLVELFPGVSEEELKEKFPIIEGELPQYFRLIREPTEMAGDNTPRIHFFGQWLKDDLNVYILVDPETREQSQNFVNDAFDAVNTWSTILRNYSGIYDIWNFNIITDVDPANLHEYPPADIIILLEGDPQGQKGCIDRSGSADLHEDAANPLYSQVFTSCINEVPSPDMIYTTVLHEFAHTLGLGHAHNEDGDLMCSIETDANANAYSTCAVSSEEELIEPSELDINALLYLYSQDGLGGENRDVDAQPYYTLEMPL